MIDNYTDNAVPPLESDVPTDDMHFQQMHDSLARDFQTIPRGMLSMFFCVTGGMDWYEILLPLMNISALYVFLFVAFISFVIFGVFNVLSAVFVESVMTNRDKDLLIQGEQTKTRLFMSDMAE